MKKVSKDSMLPLHYQLKEIIKDMIENEELKEGDGIPPERELCEIHGVSRMTVNKAIMSLVNEGLLYREQGKGTFVSKVKLKEELSKLRGFTESMTEKGLKTDTKILSFKIIKATKQNQIKLNLHEGDSVIEIKRVRFIEGEPLAIETAWLPRERFLNINKETLEGKSLYNIFREQYGYQLESATQTVEPIMLDSEEGALLNQNKGALALLFRRVTFIKGEIPIEHTKAIYRTDKYKYEVTLL